MGYMTDGLTFNTLRRGNNERVGWFKNAKGERCHDPHNGWSPAQWLQAVIGELGEYANLRKKVERGDFAQEEVQQELADELADVQIYLDLLASSVGVDLGRATMDKWNRKSRELGIPIRLDADDWRFTRALAPGERSERGGE